MRYIFAVISALIFSAAPAFADDTAALAGQTFYRAIASPQRAGWQSNIEIYNPPGSGVCTFIDAIYVWPGYTGLSAEYGLMHYDTPFDSPALAGVILDVFRTFAVPTYYKPGLPNSKTVLYGGTYPTNLNPQIDYFWQTPDTAQPDALEHLPSPIILPPGEGIVLWNPTPGLEGKAGIWIREKPCS